jgi:antitoxin ParD1/3/4
MTLNVSLTPHLEDFVRQTVTSGRYQSASEVVRTALRLLEELERERQAKLEWLRQEIHKGLNSGPATPLDIEEVKRLGRARLPTAP